MKSSQWRVIWPIGTGVMMLAAGAVSAAGWMDADDAGRWVGRHAGWLAVFGFAGALIGIGLSRALPRRLPPHRREAPALSWWVVAAATTVVAGVAWLATTALLREADQADDPGAARVEAIKTGLSIAAGTGGVFALLLAVRRQWHQERSTSAIDLDAAERRVTELYTKAAEQLGHAEAPVRLAGMYALERLAQNSPAQRQTIVNVLCAYLRMPYQPVGEPPAEDADERLVAEHRQRAQEREVRLTAQCILSDHLKHDNKLPRRLDAFWSDIDLDLTHAHLIDFTLSNCMLRDASFTSATFAGTADFARITVTGNTDFRSVTFTGSADFSMAAFAGGAYFASSTFAEFVSFFQATFSGTADFGRVSFNRASFSWAKFDDLAVFRNVHFAGVAEFEATTFRGRAEFLEAVFDDSADFDDAHFFDGRTTFGSAKLNGHYVSFKRAVIPGGVSFYQCTFERGAPAELADNIHLQGPRRNREAP